MLPICSGAGTTTMPELPEIETIKRQLGKHLVGHVVEDVEVRLRKMIPGGGEKKLIGAKVVGVRRFGKMLIIDFSNNFSAVFHLKLTGQVIYVPKNSKKRFKYTHVIFHLSSKGRSASDGSEGAKLLFNNLRQFGWIKIIKTPKSQNSKIPSNVIGELGAEPVVDPENPPENPLTLRKFKEIVSTTRRPIKVLLMDQKKISGIGNIYACDALNLAKINPTRESRKLRTEEIKKLFDAIKKVLKAGIKYKGSSEQYYLDALGQKGSYQDHFLVYSRAGKKCFNPACRQAGVRIKKIRLAGRGTFFCPRCQV